jgi:hypothetical protein
METKPTYVLHIRPEPDSAVESLADLRAVLKSVAPPLPCADCQAGRNRTQGDGA